MAKVPVINLRKGHAVNYNNDVCVVVSMEHKCPPRMASYVQMSIRSIFRNSSNCASVPM